MGVRSILGLAFSHPTFLDGQQLLIFANFSKRLLQTQKERFVLVACGI
jgi:hypothetical protein